MLADATGLYRVRGFFHYLGLVALGYLIPGSAVDGRLIVVVGAGFFALAYAYAVNNYFDRDTADRCASRRKNPLAGQASIHPLYALAVVAPAIPAALLGLCLAPGSFAILLFALAISTAYSAPPLRLKARPIAGFVSNALIFIPLFCLGWVNNPTTGPGLGWFSLFFCLPLLIMEVYHELAEAETDRREQIPTLPVWLGERAALAVLAGLYTALVVVAALLAALALAPIAATYLTWLYVAGSITMTWAFHRKQGRFSPRLRGFMRGATAVFGLIFLLLRLASGPWLVH